VHVVVQSLEQALPQVHVADGINWLCEDHTAGELPVPGAPVVLDALQMPLVHQHHNTVTLTLVDRLEEVFITLVNEDLFQLGEEQISALNIPVDQMLVKALLCECFRASLCNLLSVGPQLLCPER
jgi:hypothetical protein